VAPLVQDPRLSAGAGPRPDVRGLLERGLAAQQAREVGDAENLYREVLRIEPGNPDALHLLGVLIAQRGDAAGAVPLLRDAAAARPEMQMFHMNLGHALADSGRLDDAIAAYRRAAECAPTQPQPWFNLAGVLLRTGRYADADSACRKAVELAPDHAEALALHAIVLVRLGQAAAGVELMRDAARRRPIAASFYRRLGAALEAERDWPNALDAYRRVVSAEPEDWGAWAGIGVLESNLGEPDAACAALRRAIGLHPDDPNLRSLLISSEPLSPTITGPQLLEQRTVWATRFADPLTSAAPAPSDGQAGRRLRVGYIGADTVRLHTAAHVFLPLFRAHDPSAVEVFCYSDLAPAEEDPVTELFSAVSTVRRTHGLDDAGFADVVRQDRLDVLVDTYGYSPGSRRLAMARRLAPLQVSFPATGDACMQAIDYLIGDDIVTPPEMIGDWRRVVRLPTAYLFRPAIDPPPIDPLPPVRRRGFLTFGSLNRLSKMNNDVLSTWAEILKRVPGARLSVNLGGSQPKQGLYVVEHFKARARACGLPSDRIDVLANPPSHYGHLQRYNDIDIALDTFPYGGATTSCESFVMGVPVMTLASDRVLGRYTEMFLRRLGLPELATRSKADYVAAAVRLAENEGERGMLRQTLRQRFLESPIADAGAMARALEATYKRGHPGF
jgi:predicted O-linked N-acetylglucosamine transferase (SPINDLY family)